MLKQVKSKEKERWREYVVWQADRKKEEKKWGKWMRKGEAEKEHNELKTKK